MILKILKKVPAQRVSIAEILKHPFVTKYYPLQDKENSQNNANTSPYRKPLSSKPTAVDSNLIFKMKPSAKGKESPMPKRNENVPQMIQKSHTKSKKKYRSSSEKRRRNKSTSGRKNSLKMTPNNDKKK